MLLLAFACEPAIAQESPSGQAERGAILAVVQALFDATTAKDVAGAARVLIPDGRFHSVRLQDGKLVIRTFTSEEFLRDLPAQKQALRERMWDPEVRIRGRIADVLTPYDIWADGKFSHCGIESFDLIETDDGWKIAGGTITVESDCKPRPRGPLKQEVHRGSPELNADIVLLEGLGRVHK